MLDSMFGTGLGAARDTDSSTRDECDTVDHGINGAKRKWLIHLTHILDGLSWNLVISPI